MKIPRTMNRGQILKRVSIIDDYCEDGYEKDNPCYFYCEVYADEEQNEMIDFFCIHKKDVDDINDRVSVERFAIDTAIEYIEAFLGEKLHIVSIKTTEEMKGWIEIWGSPLSADIEQFINWLIAQNDVKEGIYDRTWTSGSSTTIYPITVCQNCVDIQWKKDNEPRALLECATALFADIISYGIFSKTDGSCPSVVHFQLKEPRY